MAANTPKEKRIYFEHLDVVRFIAAFMIVLVHAYEAWVGWYGEVGLLSNGTYKELSTGGKFIDTFIRNFGVGVDIFFLLSGFLITYILLEEKKRFGKIHIGKFMLRRTIRIWPLYFLLLALAPLLVKWVQVDHPNYWANALFINNFHAISTQTWDYPFAHFWSICVEEHFYLIWPFIIAFIPNKKLIHAFTLVIAASIFYRLFISYTSPYPWFNLYLNTLSKIDVLVIGAIGAYYYSDKPFKLNLPKPIRYLLYGILIVSFCIGKVSLWDGLFLAGFKKYFYIGLFAILLIDYNFNDKFKHLLKPGSIIHYLGKVSYGIYMYSNMLLIVVVKKIMWPLESNNIYLFFLCTIGLSIIIPIISYELFEKHVLKLNKRLRVIQTKR